jgi:inositol phosphorylceramide synthase catalytic subunit
MSIHPPGHARNVYNIKNFFLIAAIAAAYLIISYLLIGFRSEQLLLIALFISFYFISAPTRKLIIAFSIFIVYWIIFDYMKAFPNYQYQPVHIESLYNAEKKIFGISFNGSRITPNEYWLRNGNNFLDVLAGLFYLTWIPVPLLFAGYLFFKNREEYFYFSLTFLLVNIIGFIIYYAYPAAPPWYVQQHGFDFYAATPGSTAGLSKFDHFFYSGIFKSIYAKSSNVFAAMPSLHSSYPVLVLYFGVKNRFGLVNVLFAVIMIGIWFSAVYSSHHYVLDILAGILCAATGIFLFRQLALKNKPVKILVEKLMKATA